MMVRSLLASTFSAFLGVAPAAASAPTVVFRFQDASIVESSGLALVGGLFVTINDSGDRGRIFVVDSTGRTVGEQRWATRPRDTEGVAPAGNGRVWVGDIGDNPVNRSTISVLRVPVARGTRTVTPDVYRFAYPDGPHNAETLMAHPVSGRLFIGTKEIGGGSLYAAPATLSKTSVNPLTRVGRVPSMATDGAFAPNGRHFVVRTYGRAYVYSYPSMALNGSADLPAQQQGEGLAIGANKSIYLSTEGVHTPVYRYRLPDSLQSLLRGNITTPDPAESAQHRGLTAVLTILGVADVVDAASAASVAM